MKTRADQIFEAFKKFHTANPKIWELFVQFTMQSVLRGRTHYSVDAVFERIRWYVDVETVGDAVKLNNNFRAYYARMFHAKYPEYAGFFRTRIRVSEKEDAHPNDRQVFDFGPPLDERALQAELRHL